MQVREDQELFDDEYMERVDEILDGLVGVAVYRGKYEPDADECQCDENGEPNCDACESAQEMEDYQLYCLTSILDVIADVVMQERRRNGRPKPKVILFDGID